MSRSEVGRRELGRGRKKMEGGGRGRGGSETVVMGGVKY
jgi:hypothetical protein